jgi:hypothetical protein
VRPAETRPKTEICLTHSSKVTPSVFSCIPSSHKVPDAFLLEFHRPLVNSISYSPFLRPLMASSGEGIYTNSRRRNPGFTEDLLTSPNAFDVHVTRSALAAYDRVLL